MGRAVLIYHGLRKSVVWQMRRFMRLTCQGMGNQKAKADNPLMSMLKM